MVFFTVVSDLHLEGRPLDVDQVLDPELRTDVLCLLGDIGDPASPAYRSFLAACAERFPTVLLLAGNNEYRNHPNHQHQHHSAASRDRRSSSSSSGQQPEQGQGQQQGQEQQPSLQRHSRGHHQHHKHHVGDSSGGRCMAQTEELIRAAAAAHPNVHFLQNTTHVVRHVAFIGTTLWSYLPDDPLPPSLPDGVGAARAADAAEEDVAAAAAASVAAAAAEAEATEVALASIYADRLAAEAAEASAAATEAQRRRMMRGMHSQLTSLQPPHGGGGGSGGGRVPSPPSRFRSSVRPSPGLSPLAETSAVAAVDGASYADGGGDGGLSSPPSGRPSLPSPPYRAPPAFGFQHRNRKASAVDYGAAACRHRRRLTTTLRHSVSLSSLLPDAPCPPLFPLPEPPSRESSSDDIRSSLGLGMGESSSSSIGGSSSSSSLHSSLSRSSVEDVGVGHRGDGGGSGRSSSSSEGEEEGSASKEGAVGELATQQKQPEEAAEGRMQGGSGGVGDAAAGGQGQEEGGGRSGEEAAAQDAPQPSAPDAKQAPAEPPQVEGSHPPPASLRQHHHHHHHRTDPSTPTTIRDYIGATSLDFRRILTSPGGPPITPAHTNALFCTALSYIKSAVASAAAAGLTPVVLSHHAPSLYGTSHPRFAGHPSTHAYGSDLVSYMSGSGIAAWYCGHTHYNFDMVMPGGVRLASNQYGSQPHPAPGFNRSWRHHMPPPAEPPAAPPPPSPPAAATAAASSAPGAPSSSVSDTTADPSATKSSAAAATAPAEAATAAEEDEDAAATVAPCGVKAAAAPPVGAPCTGGASLSPSSSASSSPSASPPSFTSPWLTSTATANAAAAGSSAAAAAAGRYCHLAPPPPAHRQPHSLAPATCG